MLREVCPFTVLFFLAAGELSDAIHQVGMITFRGVGSSADTYDAEFFGHPVIDEQVEESGGELSVIEVATTTEDE
jgi:hypothetical protein